MFKSHWLFDRRILRVKKMLTEILISAKIVYRKGVTVKQRFALVKDNSKKQPNFGWCGCFFDVFYFFWFAGYWLSWRWCWWPSLQYRQAPKSFRTPIVLTFHFIFHMYPLLRYRKFSKCTHFGKRRTATRFGNTHVYFTIVTEFCKMWQQIKSYFLSFFFSLDL